MCIHSILHPSHLHHIQRLLVQEAVAVRGWSKSGVASFTACQVPLPHCDMGRSRAGAALIRDSDIFSHSD